LRCSFHPWILPFYPIINFEVVNVSNWQAYPSRALVTPHRLLASSWPSSQHDSSRTPIEDQTRLSLLYERGATRATSLISVWYVMLCYYCSDRSDSSLCQSKSSLRSATLATSAWNDCEPKSVLGGERAIEFFPLGMKHPRLLAGVALAVDLTFLRMATGGWSSHSLWWDDGHSCALPLWQGRTRLHC